MLLSAGVELTAGLDVDGWLLVGGEKMSKTAATWSTRSTWSPTSESTASATTCSPRRPFGQDGDFTYEGLVARYNADLANNLGNLLSRVATVVGRSAAGVGPAPAADSPLAAASAEAVAEATTPAGTRCSRADALAATWQLIRATNAYLEANEPWKAEPGPDVERVLGDALEALRIVAILASPAIPSDGPGDLGADRPARRRGRPAGPGGAGLGRLPGRRDRDEGPAAVPPRIGVTRRLVRQPLPPRRRPDRAGRRMRWPPPAPPASSA